MEQLSEMPWYAWVVILGAVGFIAYRVNESRKNKGSGGGFFGGGGGSKPPTHHK